MQAPSTIAVLTMGGTIGMAPQEPGGPVLPTVDLGSVIRDRLELDPAAYRLEHREICRSSSSALTFAQLREALVQARRAVEAGATGVVISQGTDSIEETAWFWHLHWDNAAPLVVTGAMRHGSQPGFDGLANLTAAVTVAAAPAFRRLGCLVVMNDEVHLAARVRKTHTISTGAFRSPNGGPIGFLVEGAPTVPAVTGSWRDVPFATCDDYDDLTVAVALVTLGTGVRIVEGLGAVSDGLVVAGLGGGHVPPVAAEPLGALAQRIPVVLCSRVEGGPALTKTYGYDGSEVHLLRLGLIPGGHLGPAKSAVLLRVLLAQRASRADIAAAFAAAGSRP